ncbi:MAG: hypothetical protein LW606_05840 [Ilumatobacteraceae bacterium]|nr:hypothetical protein [Ilumatobacteraceae bacterium]
MGDEIYKRNGGSGRVRVVSAVSVARRGEADVPACTERLVAQMAVLAGAGGRLHAVQA